MKIGISKAHTGSVEVLETTGRKPFVQPEGKTHVTLVGITEASLEALQARDHGETLRKDEEKTNCKAELYSLHKWPSHAKKK